LLDVKNLHTYFFTPEGVVKAVDGVSFHLGRRESLAIVGESGCGKTVTALSIIRLVPDPPGKIMEGEIFFEGRDLVKLEGKELRQIRGNQIGMIFQDPMTSLNPVYTIGNQIIEAIRTHTNLSMRESKARAIELLEMVEIPQAKNRLKDFPHEFSGGMRQRVMIAMAISCNPKILIADEPTTALDVTIQAQIIELLERLRMEVGLAVILITHDLGVVAGTAENVLVMYAGKVVEYGKIEDIYYRSKHPYAWSLMRSIPRMDEKKEKLMVIPGQPPSLINLPPGCSFQPRCPFAEAICEEEEPPLKDVGSGHLSACHFAEDFETRAGVAV
jgi:oligopeptide/dipeptide ABC transporter ATP-binding protein